MIIKHRKKPIELVKLEALIPRLPASHPKLEDLKHQLARSYKGYLGELRVDSHLEHLAQSFTILQDVTLNVNNQDFQTDTMLISDCAIYMVETKNVSGNVTFNTILKQFTQHDGQAEVGYRYPVTQVEMAKLKLTNWLQQRNLNHLPIYNFVAISEPSTIIRVIGSEEEVAKVVIHSEYLPQKILQIEEHLKKQTRKRPPINHHQLGLNILNECKEFDMSIQRKYNISPKDLLPGVICTNCNTLGMKREHGNWNCNQCTFRSKLVHKSDLKNFTTLIKPTITNRECRWWLQVTSRHVITKMLKEANFRYIKEKRYWILKDD